MIVVDGCIYQMIFNPINDEEDPEDYAFTGIDRQSLYCLKNETKKVEMKFEMLHNSEIASKNKTVHDWYGVSKGESGVNYPIRDFVKITEVYD